MKAHYLGLDRRGHLKSLYLNELSVMSEKQLTIETENNVFLCIFMQDNPKMDCHWHTLAIADEWENRSENLYMQICVYVFDNEFDA